MSASAATFLFLVGWSFVACQFVEVRILVGSQEDFLAFGYSFMTGLIAGIDGGLYASGLYCLYHSAFVFYLQEQVPCLLCDGYGQILYIIGTSGRVNDAVHVRFFFQQQLLVACDTFREFVWSFVSLVEGGYGNGVDAGNGCAHGFGLCT